MSQQPMNIGSSVGFPSQRSRVRGPSSAFRSLPLGARRCRKRRDSGRCTPIVQHALSGTVGHASRTSWSHRFTIAAAFAAVLTVAFAASASARPLVRWHRNWMPPSYTSTWHPSKRHHHHKRRPHRVQRNYRTTGVRYMAADNEHCTAQNTVPFLRAHDANVWRYIVSDNAAEFADGVPCVQAARAAGYKVFLSVKFPDADTPAQATAVIAQTVATYGQPWALSVGNEENMTSATYVADWNAAAVWLEQHAPSTIRVFGEYYPWRFTWLTNGMKLRPVGVQVVSTHCYYRGQTADGLLGIPALAKALERYRAPLWCSEMAPVLNAPAFFANQTLGQYDQDVRRVERESPNLQLVSWYEWPGIGAVTPGFGPPAPATGPGPVY